MARKKVSKSSSLYEKAEDLPDNRKQKYDSILQDFDKQVETFIEQIYSNVSTLEKQINSQFRLAKLKLPSKIRNQKAEDFYYQNSDDTDNQVTLECAKVAVSVSNSIQDEVKINVKGTTGKKKTGGRGKKSSILAQGPTSTAVRRSTRRRAAPSWISETPLASSTLTAAALGCTTATAKSSRARRNLIPAPTPIASSMITPKFDPKTPLNRTAMRTRKDEEKFLVSMNGSPVYVGGRAKAKNDNMIPVPIGNGQTLVIPADNPEVQPLIQELIKNCMSVVNKK